MNEAHGAGWLDDGILRELSQQGTDEPALLARLYDATCPSEFYRGYATLLARFNDALGSMPEPESFASLVEAFDAQIQAHPFDSRDSRWEGANFALVNVIEYAKGNMLSHLSRRLVQELLCIARCFVRNQALGL